jgi:hypothetical protein
MPRAPIQQIGDTIRFGNGCTFGTRKKFGQSWQVLKRPHKKARGT